MIHAMMRGLFAPTRLRRVTLYRGISFEAPAIGHQLLIERLCPDGLHAPDDYALVAAILYRSARRAERAIYKGRLPRVPRAIYPQNIAEQEALLAHLCKAWQAPPRFVEQNAPIAAKACKEYASTSATRLLLRVASIRGVQPLLGNFFELPIADALALIIADDELHGAHYLSAETEARLTT